MRTIARLIGMKTLPMRKGEESENIAGPDFDWAALLNSGQIINGGDSG